MNDQTGLLSTDKRPKAAKAQIEVFHAASANTLDEIEMLHSSSPAEANTGMTHAMAAGMGTGGTVRVLYKSPQPDGLSLVYAWFKSGFPLPPHSHDADCLYYVVSGELSFGTEKLGAGDGMFVPANAIYSYTPGPNGVEVLEFRNASEFDIRMLKGSAAYWSKVAAGCAESQDRWLAEGPPIRQSAGLG